MTSGPGSLMSVWVSPTGSTTLRLVRVSPLAGKAFTRMPASLRAPAIQLPVSPERMATASEVPPSLAMTLETLMPLPPASRRSSVMRLTASRVKLGM